MRPRMDVRVNIPERALRGRFPFLRSSLGRLGQGFMELRLRQTRLAGDFLSEWPSNPWAVAFAIDSKCTRVLTLCRLRFPMLSLGSKLESHVNEGGKPDSPARCAPFRGWVRASFFCGSVGRRVLLRLNHGPRCWRPILVASFQRAVGGF